MCDPQTKRAAWLMFLLFNTISIINFIDSVLHARDELSVVFPLISGSLAVIILLATWRLTRIGVQWRGDFAVIQNPFSTRRFQASEVASFAASFPESDSPFRRFAGSITLRDGRKFPITAVSAHDGFKRAPTDASQEIVDELNAGLAARTSTVRVAGPPLA